MFKVVENVDHPLKFKICKLSKVCQFEKVPSCSATFDNQWGYFDMKCLFVCSMSVWGVCDQGTDDICVLTVSGVSGVSSLTDTPLRDLANTGNVMAMAAGQCQARARDPGHWIATPLPRPAPHMIPGLRRATRPPPHYKYYFNVKHKVEFSSPTLPQLTFVALQSQFNVFFMIKDSSFKFLSLIMVDRILPRGQIRLRMYRRTFN